MIGSNFDFRDLRFKKNEICYGIYENVPDEKNERIVVTSMGLYLFEKGIWAFVSYVEIESLKLDSNKEEIEYITLLLKNGRTFFLPVRGRNRQYKDIFEFSRFLNRVISDLSR